MLKISIGDLDYNYYRIDITQDRKISEASSF